MASIFLSSPHSSIFVPVALAFAFASSSSSSSSPTSWMGPMPRDSRNCQSRIRAATALRCMYKREGGREEDEGREREISGSETKNLGLSHPSFLPSFASNPYLISCPSGVALMPKGKGARPRPSRIRSASAGGSHLEEGERQGGGETWLTFVTICLEKICSADYLLSSPSHATSLHT